MKKKSRISIIEISIAAVLAAVILILGYFYFWQSRPAAENNLDILIDQASKTMLEAESQTQKDNLIRLEAPLPDQTVASPLAITGQARGYWYFEASFPVKLYDDSNNLIAQGIATAQSDWMTEDFVPFRAELFFDQPSSGHGILVLEKDNPSGLPEHYDELSVPVNFSQDTATTAVKVYFSNSELMKNGDCNRVYAVNRTIAKTPGIARAALLELLQGPDEQEKAAGFSTNLNDGIEIQSLSIQDGVAQVDFNEMLDRAVGGSCRVIAIRAQIAETLRQFSTVDEVVISINGRIDDILQP